MIDSFTVVGYNKIYEKSSGYLCKVYKINVAYTW